MANREFALDAAIAADQSRTEREYWLKKLPGNLVKSRFPYDYDRKDVSDRSETGNRKIETANFQFTGELYSRMMWVTNGSDIRLHMVLATGMMILLHKYMYDGNNDIVVGSPIYKQEVEGDFINTIVVLHNRMTDDMTFKELLYQVKHTIDEAVENQNYPIKTLLRELNISANEREDDFPLFDVALLLENIHDKRYMLPVKTNMTFSFLRTDNSIEGSLEYNSLLFSSDTVNRIISHYINLVQVVLFNTGIEIHNIDIFSEEERKQVLYNFNKTETRYPEEKTIHGLFEDQVGKTPGNTAIVFGDKQWTYNELNRKSNRLARLLRKRGIGSDRIVGIIIESSIEQVIAILAALKAGGAYFPIDIDIPQNRIISMLEDSHAGILLTKSAVVETSACEVLKWGEFVETMIKECGDNLEHIDNAANLAYAIFTSGSTGKPKGVLVEHRNAVNTLLCRKHEYGKNPGTISLQLFSYVFDGFVTSFFTPLISGARLIFLGEEEILDLVKLKKAIIDNKVTHFISVPAIFQLIVENLTPGETSSLKVVTLAGDKISPAILDVTREKNRDIEIINEYGVTEAGVMSTLYRHQEKTGEIRIGKPGWNTTIYIVNKIGALQPIGIPGELCIGGVGVARGYLNRPELTAEMFIDYRSYRTYISKKLYKTGDLARWLSDGNIEYLGRIDYQVKIRGLRIETGEIEYVLQCHDEIKDALVTLKEGKSSGQSYLCAYFTADREFGTHELREYLGASLPEYMIPTHFVQIDKIPLNPNGKVDRKALPEPEFKLLGNRYVAPRNEAEQKLAGIWAALLEMEKDIISIDSNFFDLGGHSLKVTIMASKIQKELNAKIPIPEIFERPTIRGIVKYIEESPEGGYISIAAVEMKEYYALSSAQERMYTIQQMDLKSTAYNIPEIISLNRVIDRERLQDTFSELIDRHEILRTSLLLIEEKPYQKVHKEVEFKIEFFDLKGPSQIVERPVNEIIGNFVRPFNLSRAPLLRVGLIKLKKEKFLLVVDMHHIISDGVSHNVLVEDFMLLDGGVNLPPLSLQYKDYAEWQKREKAMGAMKQKEAFWLSMFKGELPVLHLPTDYPRPEIRDFAGSFVNFEIEKEKTALLIQLARSGGVTLYMVLLAVFNVFLAKISGQEDIVVGTPIAGRNHPDLENVLGVFVNTLALRNYPTGEKTFSQFLVDIRENTLAAFEKQDYPFENLVEMILKKREANRHPLYDVVFDFNNLSLNLKKVSRENTEFFREKEYEYEKTVSKYDLIWSCLDAGEYLLFKVIYCIKLFKAETIKRYINYFRDIVDSVTGNKDIKLKDIVISHGLFEITDNEFRDSMNDFDF